MDKQIPGGVTLLRDALRRAFRYGETYWQQADSESYKQNKKADETMAAFKAWADETAETLTAAQPQLEGGGEVTPYGVARASSSGVAALLARNGVLESANRNMRFMAAPPSAPVGVSAEDRVVLMRLKDALPDVGLNGWIDGVRVIERILAQQPARQEPSDG